MSDVKERPIVFIEQEVNAVLAGGKTQIRVPVLTGEQAKDGFEWAMGGGNGDNAVFISDIDSERQEVLVKPSPFGAIGGRLWVQELHARTENENLFTRTHYYADGNLRPDLRHDAGLLTKYSAADMPRWASRILLEITDISIERVQDTSHDDAIKEGVHHFDIEARLRDQDLSVSQIVFSRHWDIEHQDIGTEWESNPWVWVIEFKVVKNSEVTTNDN